MTAQMYYDRTLAKCRAETEAFWFKNPLTESREENRFESLTVGSGAKVRARALEMLLN